MFKKRPREEGGLIDSFTAGFIRFMGRIPWRFALSVGGFIGWLLWLIPKSTPHRVAKINIALCFPEYSQQQRRSLLRENMIALGRNAMASALAWTGTPEAHVKRVIKVENEELFDRSVASGKGVVVLAPHLGCWEFITLYACVRYEPTILFKPFGGPALNALMLEGRSRLRATMHPTTDKGVRALLASLKKGGLTAILPDHVPPDSGGIFSPFFGIKTLTGVLPVRLIERTGAIALAAYCLLDSNGSLTIRFSETDPDIHSNDTAVAVAALNRAMERCIREAPADYVWHYRRFKSIEGSRNPYNG